MKEIIAMDAKVLSEKLGELKRELSIERSAAHGVGGKANPGRIRELRRTVARILTFAHAKGMKVEPKLGKAPAAKKPEPKKIETAKKPEIQKPVAKAEAVKKPEAAKPADDDFSQMVGEVKKD